MPQSLLQIMPLTDLELPLDPFLALVSVVFLDDVVITHDVTKLPGKNSVLNIGGRREEGVRKGNAVLCKPMSLH